MIFEERAAIIEKLNLWEKKFPLETYMIEGVHIWPILKKDIFFNLYRQFDVSPVKVKSSKGSLITRIFNKIVRKPKAWFYLRKIKIEKVDFLFSGSATYRVNWENKQFNRYFDPIMDYLESKGEKSYLLEYSNLSLKEVYKSSRIIDLTEIKPLFTKNLNFEKNWNNLNVLPEFTVFINEIIKETGLTQKVFQTRLLKNIEMILGWANLYEYFLKQMKPKYIIGLCYYNQPMTGMNLAAKKLGVISMDMQHGTQGDLHCAYHYNKIPLGGYNTLPDRFLVWDEASFNNIAKWTENKIHSPILGGNPWIAFLNENLRDKIIYAEKKPMILFTLQPLDPIIDNYFLEVISLTCENYNWWLRLHPRMSFDEISELKSKLKELQIEDLVNFKDASREPLPLLLKECSLHVSKYSGSIAEAGLMNTPSLIIDEIGIKTYDNLIETKEAVPCLTKNSTLIVEMIGNIINGPKTLKQNDNQKVGRYKDLINGLMKN